MTPFLPFPLADRYCAAECGLPVRTIDSIPYREAYRTTAYRMVYREREDQDLYYVDILVVKGEEGQLEQILRDPLPDYRGPIHRFTPGVGLSTDRAGSFLTDCFP